MGIDISEEAGWLRNKGLRIIGGGALQLDWPRYRLLPGLKLVRKRDDWTEQLARQAQKAGARLYERCNVGAPIIDDRTGHITGVHAKLGDAGEKREVTFHAPLVVAADGDSTRLSLAMGLHRREDRPMGVAVRTYFTSRATRTTTWSPGWSWTAGAPTVCCPATAGSSAWATAPRTSASACSTPPTPSRNWTGARS